LHLVLQVKNINVNLFNKYNYSPLCKLLTGKIFNESHETAFNLLLQYGADVNLQNIEGDTALHILCNKTEINIKALNFLSSIKNLNPNVFNHNSKNCLLPLCFLLNGRIFNESHKNAFNMLIQHPLVNINLQNDGGQTILH